MKKHNKGFTLIELMIVVAIIAIIAAIAIPNLLRSRVQSNESAAIGNLRTMVSAQTGYHSSNNTYTTTWADLTNATPPYLESDWSNGRQGYNYALAQGEDDDGAVPLTESFATTAAPINFGTTGARNFYVDASGVIRHAINADGSEAAATRTSPTLDEDPSG